MYNHIFETYKNYDMPHDWHIHQTASVMATEKVYEYPPSQHELPH